MKLLCALIFMLTTHETPLTTPVVQAQVASTAGGVRSLSQPDFEGDDNLECSDVLPEFECAE